MAKKSAQFGAMLRNIHLNLSSEVLDEFRFHFGSSVAASRKDLQKTYDGLSDEQFECEQDRADYEGVLSDEYWQLDEVKKLGESLAIVGLYRLVETHLGAVLRVTFPSLGEDKKACLIRGNSNEIDCTNLFGFRAVDELRLINNSIKHNDSKANGKLAMTYPGWIQDKHMENLGAHYERLKPDVMAYLKAFVNEAYAKSGEFAPPSLSTNGQVLSTT
ncbi:hypothetical protein SAMN05216201_11326 [Pseudomonas linyingensis]|uniref:Uncharacterized protein n=1 Tax=Pseudomonas linyingensis TaxID=915471 RepID=A0A1H7AK20_9PSED|nr:hypothetical protein [Pseudomonas linyingensis]SEJ64934.1 hypothetical protein SAMN05216201_11326 [Pseudomonas linyingensis]